MTGMLADMREQPDVLGRIAAARSEGAGRVRALRPPDLRGVVLVARGSSDHAALYGRYVIELATGLPVSLAAPSLYTRYGVRPRLDGHLAVGVSQSGQTPEILRALEAMRDGGARTIAITADPGAPIATGADELLEIPTGAERAIPATKTFTAELAAFAVLAEALGREVGSEDQWAALPEVVGEVLEDERRVDWATAVLAGAESVVHLARGLTYAVAPEGALKMKETAGRPAEGFSSADFLHGPIAIAARALAVVCYGWPGPVLADVAEAAELSHRRGAPIVAVAPAGAGLRGDVMVAVPDRTGEALGAIPLAVRAQQLALSLALALGRDPDRPAGLHKVTATA
jgi:glucosamine--fructose-6-phosphate aminotransferase (isomerizing)